MDDRYFHGILGCEAVVCGRRLTNLTPWHVTILDSIKSPLMSGDFDMTPQDLLILVKVVNSRWPGTPNLNPGIIDIIWTVALKRRGTLEGNINTLKHWLNAQLSSPKFWDNKKSDQACKKMSSPAMLSLVMTLVGKMNITLSEAWNMRLSEARWYDAVKAELDGVGIKIAYDNDREFVSTLDGKSESEIIAIVKEQLGEEAFKPWYKARQKNKK